MTSVELAPELYLNRELAWIDFNQRVLAQAMDPRTPLLEQAKFSAIFSNNLDEFFMVRVASLKSRWKRASRPKRRWPQPAGATGGDPNQVAATAGAAAAAYRDTLRPQLAEHGVQVLDYEQLNGEQRAWVNKHFRSAIFPVLTPLAVDPAHPFHLSATSASTSPP